MSKPFRAAVAALLISAAMLVPATADAKPGLLLGFSDVGTIQNDPLQRPLELQHLKSTRATLVRLMWKWSDIETAKPPDNATARNPNWTGYNWAALDATLGDISTAGLKPIVEMSSAPAWWEGAGRPAVTDTSRAGTWRPDPAAFGRFMHAAALRYAGRVRFWQVWNEPTLPQFLNPQWKKTSSGYKPASPAWYRKMLNAAYGEIKSASSATTVITAGTAPFGEPKPGGTRMPAALFVRELLCVKGRSHPRAKNCRKNPVKFDILAHHPYPIGPPGRRAINPDDVVVPDFAKLTKPLAVALKAGNVYPHRRKPVWATEMSWDSSPPDPGGIEALRQARYAAGAMYVLWRQGVSALIWWNLRDDAPGKGYEYSLQSGVFFRGPSVATDTPKPSFTAFRFPFVAYGTQSEKRGKRLARVWGIAPASGSVRIQRQSGAIWKTERTLRAKASHVFQVRIAAARGTVFRATQSSEISVTSRVF
jgi:hypothetical protein